MWCVVLLLALLAAPNNGNDVSNESTPNNGIIRNNGTTPNNGTNINIGTALNNGSNIYETNLKDGRYTVSNNNGSNINNGNSTNNGTPTSWSNLNNGTSPTSGSNLNNGISSTSRSNLNNGITPTSRSNLNNGSTHVTSPMSGSTASPPDLSSWPVPVATGGFDEGGDYKGQVIPVVPTLPTKDTLQGLDTTGTDPHFIPPNGRKGVKAPPPSMPPIDTTVSGCHPADSATPLVPTPHNDSMPPMKKKKPKPTFTVDESGVRAVPDEQVHKESATSGSYVIPVVAVILMVPLVIALLVFFYRRGTEFWERRHYRRMDFLIDGMYNDWAVGTNGTGGPSRQEWNK